MPLDFTVGVERTLGRPKNPQEIIRKQQRLERLDGLREEGGYGVQGGGYLNWKSVEKHLFAIKMEEQKEEDVEQGMNRSLKHLQYITYEPAQGIRESLLSDGYVGNRKCGRVFVSVARKTSAPDGAWKFVAEAQGFQQQRMVVDISVRNIQRAINDMIAKIDQQIETRSAIWNT